jgi:hypothetical protein
VTSNTIVNDCANPDADYPLLLSLARAGLKMAPDRDDFLWQVVVARHRMGTYQEALEAYALFEEALLAKGSTVDPSNLLFLAMTHHQLGNRGEAEATLQQVRQHWEGRRLRGWHSEVYAEAKSLIEGTPG